VLLSALREHVEHPELDVSADHNPFVYLEPAAKAGQQPRGLSPAASPTLELRLEFVAPVKHYIAAMVMLRAAASGTNPPAC
jgi:hypothetical protein